jgi:hypothetical protein
MLESEKSNLGLRIREKKEKMRRIRENKECQYVLILGVLIKRLEMLILTER